MSVDLTQFWLDRPELKARRKEFHIFSTSFVLQTNVTIPVVGSIQTRAGYDFVITDFRAMQTFHDPTPTDLYQLAPLQIQITNESRSRSINQDFVDWSHLGRCVSTGNATGPTRQDSPWEWPYPIVLEENSQVSIRAKAGFAAPSGPWTMYFSFHGIRVFHN